MNTLVEGYPSAKKKSPRLHSKRAENSYRSVRLNLIESMQDRSISTKMIKEICLPHGQILHVRTYDTPATKLKWEQQ